MGPVLPPPHTHTRRAAREGAHVSTLSSVGGCLRIPNSGSGSPLLQGLGALELTRGLVLGENGRGFLPSRSSPFEFPESGKPRPILPPRRRGAPLRPPPCKPTPLLPTHRPESAAAAGAPAPGPSAKTSAPPGKGV